MPNQTSDRLKRDSSKILYEWKARAYKEIPASWNVTSLLMDAHFLSFLDQLSDALRKTTNRTGFRAVQDRECALEFAKQHQKDRVSLGYTLATIVLELQIMREVILHILEEDVPIPVADRIIILKIFDQTLSDVAVRFADTQKEIQEHFALTLVHDLRTPVSVAKMCAHIIQRDRTASENSLRAVEKIDKSMDRIESMLKELLDVSRIRAGMGLAFEFEEFRLDVLAKEVVLDFKETYGERFELHADEPTTGTWNRAGLRRVIENLLVNAFKYGGPNTRIRVTIIQNTTHAILTVHNDGNPIPIEDQPKLFEKFLRVSMATSKTGWGLGLTLVGGMVTSHHGTVRVESSEAKGTDFIVELPKKNNSLKYCPVQS